MVHYRFCIIQNLPSIATFAVIIGLLPLLVSKAMPALAQQKPTTSLKVAAALQKSIKKDEPAEVRILPTDAQQLQKWLKNNLPHANLQPGKAQSITLSNLQPGDIIKLKQCPWITYIDRANRKAREELELKDSDLSANNISAVHALYPNLNGTGFTVSIKENPFDTTDIDLKGRVVTATFSEESHSMHATTMATVIAGAGNSSPAATGVAPAAQVASSSFANLMPDDAATLVGNGISVQNHSYGVGLENYYGLESIAYDEQALAYPRLLHVFSSGNSGGQTPETGAYAGIAGVANLTGQFKTSKNTLSVGALNEDRTVGSLSSVGPAYDGRVKPELVAHGVGGTSEAAAVASGVALLVQQAYATEHNTLPTAALVKAILINSADDVENFGPDFKSGYGNVDALGAVQAVQEQRFFSGTIAAGATDKFVLQVPENVDELKVTLVWHDAAASPDAPSALVNDLDLRLRHTSSGQIWLPWVLNPYPHPDSLNKTATRQPDHLNNVEQITFQLPSAGSYEIQVNGYAVPQGPQTYSIAYEYSTGLTWTFPSQGTSLNPGQSNRLRWSGQSNGTGSLYYKWSTSSEWALISDAVDLSQPYFDWIAPDTMAVAQLRLSTNKQDLTSPEFILAAATQPAVTLNCGDEVLLQWQPVAGASGYQLYSLQGNYLQPLQTSLDTVAILSSSTQAPATYFAVSPVLNSMSAARSQSVTFNPGAELCYINNFLPKQLTMDSVLFDLSLSTSYQVKEVALERWEQGVYKTVSSTAVNQQQSFTFHDPVPKPGLNRYRARVVTRAQPYYSQEEDIFFTAQGFIQVAPNPVVAGEEVQIVAHGEGTAQLQLYNLMGQLVHTSSDSGTIKTIPTAGLAAGIYILRLYTEQGQRLSARLLVQ